MEQLEFLPAALGSWLTSSSLGMCKGYVPECGGWHCLAAQERARSVFSLGAVPSTANFLYPFMRLFSRCCLVWDVLLWSFDLLSGCDSFHHCSMAWQRQHGAVCHGQSTFFVPAAP